MKRLLKKVFCGLICLMLFANNISYATVTKSSKTGSIAKAQKVPQIYFNNGLLKSSKKSFYQNNQLYIPINEIIKACNMNIYSIGTDIKDENNPFEEWMKGLRIDMGAKTIIFPYNSRTVSVTDIVKSNYKDDMFYDKTIVLNSKIITKNGYTFMTPSILRYFGFSVQQNSKQIKIYGTKLPKGVKQYVYNIYNDLVKANLIETTFIDTAWNFYSNNFISSLNLNLGGLSYVNNYERLIGKTIWLSYNGIIELWKGKYLGNLDKIKIISFSSSMNITIEYNGKKYNIQSDILEKKDYYLSNPYKWYKWSTKDWNAVKNNEINLGMTEDMIIMSIGRPQDINNTDTVYGSSSQWVYRDNLFYGDKYLYFEDGKLTTIQD